MNEFSGLSEEVGSSLAARRQELDASLRSIAAKADVSPSHLSDIEKGKSQVSLPVLLRLVRALDLTVSDLLPRIGGRRVRAGSIAESPMGVSSTSHDELELSIDHLRLAEGEQHDLPNPAMSELLIHVLDGALVIIAADVAHDLDTGDTFDSERLEHALVIAKRPTTALISHRKVSS